MKANIRKVQKAGKKTIWFDDETAKDLAFILKNDPAFNIGQAVKEGLKRVKRSVAKRIDGKLTQIN